MKQIGVGGKRRLALFVLGNRNLVRLGKRQQFGARSQIPLAPRHDHPDVGIEGRISELEAHLIVALAGCSMGHRVGAGFSCNLNLTFGDQGPGNRRAQHVGPFIKGIGTQHRENIVAHKLVPKIFDENLFNTQLLSLAPCLFELGTLSEIGSKGDDLAAVCHFEPF